MSKIQIIIFAHFFLLYTDYGSERNHEYYYLNTNSLTNQSNLLSPNSKAISVYVRYLNDARICR